LPASQKGRKSVRALEVERSALLMIGLAMRAGRLVLGTTAVREAAKHGKLSGAVIATDATDNARARVLPLLSACNVQVVKCGSVRQLGQAVGKERLAIIGVTDAGFADRLMAGLPAEDRSDRSENC